MGGHSKVQKTYCRVARELFWPGMKGDIANMVAQCDICQRQKYSSMDFITGLPKLDGYSVIFVVVYWLSKYAHFISLKHPYTDLSMASVFLREVVRLHGMPKTIVSNLDKVFLVFFGVNFFVAGYEAEEEQRLPPTNG